MRPRKKTFGFIFAHKEGHDSLAGFIRSQSFGEMPGLAGDAISDILGGQAHQGAGNLHGLRRFGGNLFRRLHHFRLQRILGNDLIDDPGFLRGFRCEAVAERQEGKGLLTAHQRRRKQAGTCFRHEAEIDKRRAE